MQLTTRNAGNESPAITIVGDFILDRYWHGVVTRTNPESPGVIVSVDRQTHQLGGAGGVLAVASGLGLVAASFGAVGNDKDGYDLAQMIDEYSSGGSVICWSQPQTTVKHRVVANGVLTHTRYDFEEVQELSGDEAKSVSDLPLGKVIVFADYGKGALSSPIIDAIQSRAEDTDSFILCDPARGRPLGDYGHVDMFKMNALEARELTGRGPGDAAKQLAEEYDCGVVVTDGGDGMFYADEDGAFLVPARPSVVMDVTGAGDTVVAAIALGVCRSLHLLPTLELAAELAAQQVSQVGVGKVRESRRADRV